jgi:hypothetical protein
VLDSPVDVHVPAVELVDVVGNPQFVQASGEHAVAGVEAPLVTGVGVQLQAAQGLHRDGTTVGDPWGNALALLDLSKGRLRVDREKRVRGVRKARRRNHFAR